MLKAIKVVSLLPYFLLLLSCNNTGSKFSDIFLNEYVSIDSFKVKVSNQYSALLNQPDSLLKELILKDINIAQAWAYQMNEFQPIWFSSKGFNTIGNEIIDQVHALEVEGIVLQDSIMVNVKSILKNIAGTKTPTVQEVLQWDSVLTSVYLTAAHRIQMGRPIKPIDNQWFVANDSIFTAPDYLVQTLKKGHSSFPVFDSLRSTIPTYSLILQEIKYLLTLAADTVYMNLKRKINKQSEQENLITIIQKEIQSFQIPPNDSSASNLEYWLKKYQQHHQLKLTGKLDESTFKELNTRVDDRVRQLQVNLERLRNLSQHLGSSYIWVNIPLMELEYIKDNKQLFHANVVVGKPARATPSITAPMTNIVFNPPWGVPPTILKNDVGPGIARSGAGYLSKKGLRAYDNRGRDVTASVNSNNYRKYMISQPPGARNALGDVKFNMPNKEAIFIHDTPDRGVFKYANRALSSGCVRTERPRELAELILQSPAYTASSIAEIINTRKTKSQDLEKSLPVYIMYLTVAPNAAGDGIVYLRDIYQRDKKMLAAK